MAFEQVAVLGAGVMGGGIAAQLANAGASVLLLDVAGPSESRDAPAARGLEAVRDAEPPALMHRRNLGRIAIGNLDDDLPRLARCGWIIEAVVERLEVKHSLYRRIATVVGEGTIVSSNTSTIPLARLTEPMPARWRESFLITHFFNPPRYMRLVELVRGPSTRSDAVEAITGFLDRSLGKTVVEAKDTPGFIANRIGALWLGLGVAAATEAGIGVETADAVLGAPFGIPRTGVFGLLDLVGLDVMLQVRAALDALLPGADPIRGLPPPPAPLTRAIAEGYTGRKGKGGFYRLRREAGERVREVMDLGSGEYRPAERPRPACLERFERDGLPAMLEDDDPAARYAWRVMSRTLVYAASLVPEIADRVDDVDEAVRLGLGWRRGPFELIDALGARWLAEQVRAEGLAVPALLGQAGDGGFYRVRDGEVECLTPAGGYVARRRRPGTLQLADVKRARSREAGNRSASLWDIGEDVLCLELHGPRDTLDTGTLEMIERAADEVERGRRGLVVYRDGDNFSVGANVGLILYASHLAMWEAVNLGLARGQDAYRRLKFGPFPVVGAPSGLALGGGCELLLHCDAVQAHAETYMGLVEVGVGLLPGWGGCKEMLARWLAHEARPRGPMPAIQKVFELIALATVARSAEEARDHLFLRSHDRITMNRERLLADARERVIELAQDYVAPDPPFLALPGPSGRAALALAIASYRRQGIATEHDALVAGAVADVLCGGDADITEPVGEDAVLALERAAFLGLLRTAPTAARLEHMLATGRPLRN